VVQPVRHQINVEEPLPQRDRAVEVLRQEWTMQHSEVEIGGEEPTRGCARTLDNPVELASIADKVAG